MSTSYEIDCNVTRGICKFQPILGTSCYYSTRYKVVATEASAYEFQWYLKLLVWHCQRNGLALRRLQVPKDPWWKEWTFWKCERPRANAQQEWLPMNLYRERKNAFHVCHNHAWAEVYLLIFTCIHANFNSWFHGKLKLTRWEVDQSIGTWFSGSWFCESWSRWRTSSYF